MQSLYSYFSSPNNEVNLYKQDMIKAISSIADLHITIISFIIELHKYADSFLEGNQFKSLKLPFSIEDHQKFINNKVISLLKKERLLISETTKISSIFRKGELGIIKKVFLEMVKSDQYKDYLKSKENSLDQDKKFILDILDNFILDNDIFHHILKERSIYWIDDLPFVAIFLRNQIKSIEEKNNNKILVGIFKNAEDKKFATDLFKKTIIYADEFKQLIDKNSQNWELDRIANMDILLINMALTEVVEFKEMPIKVTFNEYLEISKYYSTENSRVFINGILDKIISQFQRKGKVNKVGRGLV